VSTRVILGAVGAVVGAYFGNPQLGWAIGSAIGGAVDPEIIKGPSIGDIIDQTALEGGPRPIVFALSKPIAGNIIAQGPPRIVRRRESQGKGGPKVETESVYRTYAIGVCEGDCSFVRIWRNGQLVYDILDPARNEVGSITLFGQTFATGTANGAFMEHARFFTGSFEQLPSPDLEAILGVGTTPAHRGTTYMVMADEDLTDLRGAIPQWTFQVQRCPVQLPMILALSREGPDSTHQVMRSTDGENFTLCVTPDVPASPGEGFEWSGMAHSRELNMILAVGEDNGGPMMLSEDGGVTWELIDHGLGTGGLGWKAVAWHPTLGLFAAVRPDATQAIGTSPDGRTWTLQSTPSFLGAACIIAVEGGMFIAGGASDNIAMTSSNGTSWALRTTPVGMRIHELIYKAQHVWAIDRTSTDFMMESLDGGITWSQLALEPSFGLGDLAIQSGNTSRIIFVSLFGVGYSDDTGGTFVPIDDALTTHWEGACYSEAFSGFYISNGPSAADGIRVAKMSDGFDTLLAMNTPVSADGGQWDKLLAIDSASAGGECTFTVAQVVTEICERAGLPANLIDVSQLESQNCRGFMVVNSYPCFTALRSLSEIFLFDAASFDGKLNFVRRGGNTVATITEDDMLDDEADIEQARRSDPISIPRVLNLNYHDVAGGIATDKQTSERSGDRRSVGEANIQSAVMMSANEAAQAVAINHKIMIEDQRGELKFCLGDNFIGLVPSDNVIVQWQGRSVRTRLAKVDTNDGYQEYRCLHDRQSAYTSNVEGIPAAPQTPPPSSVVGPTLIQPLDIHILRDADDSVGLLYYVAISGVLQAWQGALVELSLDAGANYINSASTSTSSVIGELISSLGGHPAEFPDDVNTVSILIHTPFAELAETDLTGMLNGANLAIIGDELIQFANADEVVEGTWQLSSLLRGRKGSQSVAHSAGERFVLLDPSTLNLVPASLADVGRALTFRATSLGMSVDTGTVVTISYTGRSQIEREPAYVMAHRDGVNAVVTWQGVGRLGSGATVAHGQRFAGYRVTFDDGTVQQVVDTDDQELTHDVSALGSPITISVSQLNDLTGAGPSIEVIIT
jgi:hypothetical protein